MKHKTKIILFLFFILFLLASIISHRYILALITFLIVASYIYIQDYYRASIHAISSLSSSDNIEIIEKDRVIYFVPKNPTKGLIFYPGAKVEAIAYAPLLKKCSEEGILCALVKMPFHLAVLKINGADGIQNQFPNISSWYIGGHSLGGAMAAFYLSKHLEEYDGFILLASYSTKDLSKSNKKVLSILVSNDNILEKKAYERNKKNLPLDYQEYMIDGGCHSYFGSYGNQDGDGNPTISNSDQIIQTASIICKFIHQK